MKLKKLILHIGVHKTGSTAIQTFLYKNNNLLNKQGFYMPDFLYCPEHKPAEIRYSILKKDSKRTKDLLKQMIQNAKEKQCDTVIISDEDYCKANEHDLSNVKIFGEFFEEIEVLIYCRRPDRQSESGYAFCVMWETSKYSQSPEYWYSNNPGKNYFFIANFYQQTIQGCNIKLVSYDFNSNRLIDSFITACNMKEEAYTLPYKNESNISANKYMIEVMNEVNKYKLNNKLFKEIKEYVLNHKELQNGPKPIFFSNEQRITNQHLIEKVNQKFIDVFNNGEEIFKPLTPIEVPPGLDAKKKKAIVNEIIEQYNLNNKKEAGSIIRFTEFLNIKKSITNADIFREIALLCEYMDLINTAYKLIKLAKINRPEGPIIHKKFKEIKLKAKKDNNKSSDLFNIIGLIDKAYSDYNVADEITRPIRKNLKISNKIKPVELVREIALFCEFYGEISASYFFMMLAKRLKPNGKMITEKCNKYRYIITDSQKKEMPKVFLHMGANKTASTSIQCSLSANRDFLRNYKDGYLFNKSWRINSSKTFKYLCAFNFEATRMYIKEGKVDNNLYPDYDSRYLDEILDEIKNFNGVNHIFSGEDLHFLSYRSMYRVKEMLMQLIPNCEIHVLYSVRNYVSFINSNIQQSAKGGRGEKDILHFKLKSKDYFKSAIKKMISIFGLDNVTIYAFEESIKHEFGPVGYFFEQIGIDKQVIQTMKIQRKNESMSNTAAKLIFCINKKLSKIDNPQIFNFDKVRKFLRPLHKISGNSNYTLDNKYVKKLYPSMKKEAIWLKKTCNIDYTNFENKDNVKLVFDEAFENDVKNVFNELNHIIKHVAYLCFLEKSKSWFIDSTSKKTFTSLVHWCKNNHPQISRKDYLSQL